MAISIHALREEGDQGAAHQYAHRQGISIHALREEGDEGESSLVLDFGISIHALREEGDTVRPEVTVKVDVFLSTPSARRATPD